MNALYLLLYCEFICCALSASHLEVMSQHFLGEERHEFYEISFAKHGHVET